MCPGPGAHRHHGEDQGGKPYGGVALRRLGRALGSEGPWASTPAHRTPGKAGLFA